MEISGLEDEFRLSHSIPRLLYVKSPAPEREPRLTAMIEELQSEGNDSYRSFRSPRELGRLVRDDLALLLSERFATADVRADRSTSPASSSDRRGPRSLPVTSTSLIGREHDLVEVSELLRSPGVRLVTLTGPGGIGKTRLAIAVGEQLDAQLPARDSVRAARGDRSARAGAASHRRRGGRDHRGFAARHWTSWPSASRTRRRLLVLDNLEQVVGVALELDELLARSPGLDDPGDQPHRASAPGRAGVPGRSADGARRSRSCHRWNSWRHSGRAAVRRSSAGRPLRLLADRGQHVGRRRDLPAPRWSAARHRARRGSHTLAGTGCIARSARKSPRRLGYRSGRSSRTSTHAPRHGRVEHRAARRSGAAHARHPVGVRRRDGRSTQPCTFPSSPRIGCSISSMPSPVKAS